MSDKIQTAKQLRRRLKAYKKRKRYTWHEIALISPLGEPWLTKFAGGDGNNYHPEYLDKLWKFLERKDK